VVLGSAMVGTIHPSKLYNILAVGSPVLYVGPERSHITDAMEKNNGINAYVRVDFGDVPGLTAWLAADWANWREGGRTMVGPDARNYSQDLLLPQLVQIVEGSR
jgi:hypothetical protein